MWTLDLWTGQKKVIEELKIEDWSPGNVKYFGCNFGNFRKEIQNDPP